MIVRTPEPFTDRIETGTKEFWHRRALHLRAERDVLLAALKRAEYLVTGQDYLDALAVIRAAMALEATW
jgi:flagellar biosynthesis regulator FlbT